MNNEDNEIREFDVDVTEKAYIENPDQVKTFVVFQFLYSVLGLIAGVIFLVGGIFLSLLKIESVTSLKISVSGFGADLKTAIPGVALALIGVFCIWISAYKVKISKSGKK